MRKTPEERTAQAILASRMNELCEIQEDNQDQGQYVEEECKTSDKNTQSFWYSKGKLRLRYRLFN